ncbi:Uncharacterised protein [Moraxella caprae]|uniref:Uncharacterized protein n=1 Tax=Moraxella caprae TaxID=90240 RepID=A0A378R675_9GAMM|nr:Uncharacterised protein [Moraxella caprae]
MVSLSNHNGFPPPLNKLGANGKPSFAGSLFYILAMLFLIQPKSEFIYGHYDNY